MRHSARHEASRTVEQARFVDFDLHPLPGGAENRSPRQKGEAAELHFPRNRCGRCSQDGRFPRNRI